MLETPPHAAMPRSTTLRERPTISMVALLLVQIVIGYEWFISGLVKIVHGDFPSGLAEEVLKKMPAAVGWYGAFLRSAVVPNAPFFGYAIEIAELLAGIVLIAGPVTWLLVWDRVSDNVRRMILFFIALATIGGAVLAINLHLLNAASHPWLIPKDSFDEGIDLDSVLPALQIVIAWFSIVLYRRLGDSRVRGDHSMQPPRTVEAI